jgi:hypothetical protein
MQSALPELKIGEAKGRTFYHLSHLSGAGSRGGFFRKLRYRLYAVMKILPCRQSGKPVFCPTSPKKYFLLKTTL